MGAPRKSEHLTVVPLRILDRKIELAQACATAQTLITGKHWTRSDVLRAWLDLGEEAWMKE